jgi:hypothetical protein
VSLQTCLPRFRVMPFRMSIDLKSTVKVAGVMTQGRDSSCGCNQVRV